MSNAKKTKNVKAAKPAKATKATKAAKPVKTLKAAPSRRLPAPGATRLTLPSDRELRVERVFAAPRAEVWSAMTEPEQLAQWWGRGNRLVIERYELHRGGHWRFVEHSPHGVHGFEGRFREVKAPELLSMTFEWDGQPGHVLVNTLVLTAVDAERTLLVATSLYMTREDRDGMMHSGMEEGMNASYAALDRVLAARR